MLADLQIAVIPDRDGLWAQRCRDLVFVVEVDSSSHYWYSLDLVNMGPSSGSQALVDKDREIGYAGAEDFKPQ